MLHKCLFLELVDTFLLFFFLGGTATKRCKTDLIDRLLANHLADFVLFRESQQHVNSNATNLPLLYLKMISNPGQLKARSLRRHVATKLLP